MILKSFSKINLTLGVNSKIKRKHFHQIESVFCLTNLYDEITIKKIKKRNDVVKIKGKFARQINKKNNSVTKTLKILRKKNLIKDFYSISINKKIPVFSGLGGGTSNAVFLLKFLVKNIDKRLIQIFQDEIGSDTKLFFYKRGFLKNLATVVKLKNKETVYFLIVYPNIKCSTKAVYSKVKNYSNKTSLKKEKAILENKFLNFIKSKRNDLQKIVEIQHPKIKNLALAIQKTKGCFMSRMTGSGSVCYGVFKSKKNAGFAAKLIKSKYPSYWVSVAKTI